MEESFIASPDMKPAPGFVRTVLRLIARVLLGIVLLGMILWGALAIYYSDLSSASLRTTLSYAFVGGSALLLLFLRPRRRAIGWFLVGFAGLVFWWLSIPPSQDRDWQPDVAVLPYATFAGDLVTIHNIRNNDYRSETDYTPRYYDKTFDLSKLRTMDMFISFWGSPYIAHTIVSFGFDGDDYVAFSIETRKTKDEEYSAIKGFFKQYELFYVISDERDVVRLRTNYRGEDVYLYRLQAPLQPSAELARKVFLDYLKYVNHLHEHPEWYNAFSHNCTTAIRGHVAPYAVRSLWSWKILVNGRLDEMLYERKTIDQSLPLAELKARSHINERAKAADGAPDFSKQIRAGLPRMGE
jgi:hypothetical protein